MAVIERYSLLDVMGVEFFLQRRVEAGAVGAFDPERVAWYECFAECDEIAALLRAFGDPVGDLFKRCIALEPDRSDLAQRDG